MRRAEARLEAGDKRAPRARPRREDDDAATNRGENFVVEAPRNLAVRREKRARPVYVTVAALAHVNDHVARRRRRRWARRRRVEALEDVAPAPQGSKILEEAVDGHARRPGERAPELRAERDRSRRVTVRDYVRTRRRRAGPAPASREPPPRTRPRRRADEARAHAGPKASGALAGRARRGEADGPIATRGDLDREAVGERVLEHVVPELSAVRQRHRRGGGTSGYAVDARRRRLRPDAGVRAVVGAGQRRAAAVQRAAAQRIR